MKKSQKLKNRVMTNQKIKICHKNSVKCSKKPAESPEHREIKWILACYCWDHNLDFSTEVVWDNNSRSDFVIHDWNLCVEVLKTESLKDFAKKNYPMPMLPIKVSMFKYQILDMLDDIANIDGDAGYYIKKYCV